jgi:hypothetical protein
MSGPLWYWLVMVGLVLLDIGIIAWAAWPRRKADHK